MPPNPQPAMTSAASTSVSTTFVLPGWNPDSFARDHRAALEFLCAGCDRTLARDRAARPRAPTRRLPRCASSTRRSQRAARELGALIVDLSTFGARNHVMADRVHPTAFGQVAIAERALAVLARDGIADARSARVAAPLSDDSPGAVARRLDLRLSLGQASRTRQRALATRSQIVHATYVKRLRVAPPPR